MIKWEQKIRKQSKFERLDLLEGNLTKKVFDYFLLVYLYGYASNTEHRKTVPQIRAGEYEGLAEKVTPPYNLKCYTVLKIRSKLSHCILNSIHVTLN